MKLGISWEYTNTWALYYLKDHPIYVVYYNSWYIDCGDPYCEDQNIGVLISGATPNNGTYVKLI